MITSGVRHKDLLKPFGPICRSIERREPTAGKPARSTIGSSGVVSGNGGVRDDATCSF